MLNDQIKSETEESFTFTVNGFKKLSFLMIIVVALSLLLTWGGFIMLIEFLGLFFIFFPRMYKKLRLDRISIRFLKLSSGRLQSILSLIPLVNLNGEWFIEQYSEEKNLKGIKDFFSFFSHHWFEFFVINAGLVGLGARVAHILQNIFKYEGPRNDWGLGSLGFLFVFIWVPLCLAAYFSLVWVWEDSELKIARVILSSKGKNVDGTSIREIKELWLASTALRNLIAFLAGVSAVTWLAEQITSIAAERGTPIETITGLSLLVGLMFLTSGSAILMGTMYYRSGIHEGFVNNFRNHIKIKNNAAKAKNKQYSIQIGTMSFKESNQGLNSLELSSII
jgi:hypothetical protein